jgi:hypothetical protein
VIEDCVAFKEWLQRSIDEKKLNLDPQAVNPDYHQVNMVSAIKFGACEEYQGDEVTHWLPLSQVQNQFEGLQLSPIIPRSSEQSWHEVQRRHQCWGVTRKIRMDPKHV